MTLKPAAFSSSRTKGFEYWKALGWLTLGTTGSLGVPISKLVKAASAPLSSSTRRFQRESGLCINPRVIIESAVALSVVMRNSLSDRGQDPPLALRRGTKDTSERR